MSPELYSQEIDASRRFRFRKFELIFRAYFYLGVITAVFAVAYFLLSIFHLALSAEQRIALTVAGIGAAVAIISRWFVTTSREKALYQRAKQEQDRDLFELISTWAQFEELSKNALGLQDDDV